MNEWMDWHKPERLPELSEEVRATLRRWHDENDLCVAHDEGLSCCVDYLVGGES